MIVSSARSGTSIYLQALDSTGAVGITASSANYTSSTTQVSLGSLGIGVSVSSASSFNPTATLGSDGKFQTTTISAPTTLTASLYVMNPNTGAQGTSPLPRPGISSWTATIASSNPAAGALSTNTIQFANGQSSVNLTFTPAGVGQSDIIVTQPAGFTTPVQIQFVNSPPVDLSRVSFNVTAPALVASNLFLAKDTVGYPAVQLPGTVASLSKNLAVTITSGDPSKLMFSLSADAAPGGSITATIAAGQSQTPVILAHALANTGTVLVTISAPGFLGGTFNVILTDLAFLFSNTNPTLSSGTISVPLQSGPQNLRVTMAAVVPPGLPSGYSTFGASLRPGAADVIVAVNTSDATIIAVDTPQMVFHAGDSSALATYHPVANGTATLSLAPPAGYVSDPVYGQLNFVVMGALLNGSVFGSTIGKDLQTNLVIMPQVPFLVPTAITITSGDSSSLLVAPDVNTPGQASLTITVQAGAQPNVWVQALRDSGTISVSISSPGYQSSTIPITLVPSAAIFIPNITSINSSTGSKTQLNIILAPLNPANNQPYSGFFQAPRPGVDISVAVTSSDNSILLPPTAAVPITIQGHGQAQFSVLANGVGTATLSLGALPGEPAASLGQQIVFTIHAPDLSIPPITLGNDLMIPVQVSVSSQLAAPQNDTTIFISTSDTSLIGMSTSPAANGQSSITVVIPKGQRVSSTFYIQAFAAAGTASLEFSGGSYSVSGAAIALAPTAFIFKEASQPQPLSQSPGATVNYTLIPTVLPLGTPAPAPFAMRPNFGSIAINVESSNPGVAAVQTTAAYFSGGDQQQLIAVKAVSSGNTTLTLSGAPYVLNSPQSTLTLVVH